MEIKHFKLIKTIVEEGNIANSAEKLFLTQSALSHQLRDLETRLNVKIFVRSRNQWELTEEGKQLYLLANTVLTEITEGLKSIEHIKEGTKGTIKISTECYTFYQSLPTFIQKMGVLYPAIDIDLMIDATHHPVDKLISKELDIAIVTTPSHQDELVSIPFFKDEIFAIVHNENPLSQLEFLSAQDFQHVHLLIHSYPLETVSVYEHFLKPNHITPLKISAIPLTEVSLEMVKANMGIMCIPKWALKYFKLPGELVFKPIGKKGLKRQHFLCLQKESLQKKYINDFIDNIKDDFIEN